VTAILRRNAPVDPLAAPSLSVAHFPRRLQAIVADGMTADGCATGGVGDAHLGDDMCGSSA
jgi:hypothetical protein